MSGLLSCATDVQGRKDTRPQRRATRRRRSSDALERARPVVELRAERAGLHLFESQREHTIYRAVEQVDGIADSLVVCCELPGGAFDVPLFLRLQDARCSTTP